jgi:hypothetical protein
MRVFPLTTELLDAKYHGTGHALVAIHGATVVDLVYLHDVLPDFDPGESDPADALCLAIEDPRLRPAVEQLRPQGEVSIGLLSCSEFCEL